ncbi:MAG: sulfite exporter TauE/SafE family protein [Verrucomicrobia bacterium]|nr:sulfite exporter TauE/SafE family protein [Verrucomicrobiota bacterium]
MSLDGTQLLFLGAAIFAMAVLYSSVGHGGASGYTAVMALFSISAASIKPTALVLNIFVSAIAAVQFFRAGHFQWSRFWPFAVTSVPLAYVGGAIHLPTKYHTPLLGSVLLFSAARLFFRKPADGTATRPAPLYAALLWGAALGLLSGLTGVGGGIFLSPLLLFARWADARQASGTVTMFILVNSVAGLLGHLGSVQKVPDFAGILVIAAVAGALIGSYFGSRRLPVPVICRTLAVVLVIAGIKLILP